MAAALQRKPAAQLELPNTESSPCQYRCHEHATKSRHANGLLSRLGRSIRHDRMFAIGIVRKKVFEPAMLDRLLIAWR